MDRSRELAGAVTARLPPQHQSFVVDCGIVAESDEGAAPAASAWWVIELNPFSRSTSACLFSWGMERDILEGNSPFEFRTKSL